MRTIEQSNPKQILKRLIAQNKELKFEAIPIDGYEQVLKVTHEKSGLQAIIAIHDTTLGPALGGTRIYPYRNFNEALEDVLRLSKGMTYKSALAEVGLGGGKSVIIASEKEKSHSMLFAFAEAVNALEGLYICAEDVGCSVTDIEIIHQKTKFVTGVMHEKSSKDPAPFTAWGTFLGILSAAKKVFCSKSLLGKTVAIQGLGNVGSCLLDYLFWAGAEVIVSDLNEQKLKQASQKYRATIVDSNQIMKVPCDIFAPCAMGGILNKKSIADLQCKIVAGAANNQLLEDEDAKRLKAKGILYAPDFVINAGGLINVACEIEQASYNPKVARDRLYGIYDRLMSIYEISDKNNMSTHEAAISLGDYRIQYGVGKRAFPPVFHHGIQ